MLNVYIKLESIVRCVRSAADNAFISQNAMFRKAQREKYTKSSHIAELGHVGMAFLLAKLRNDDEMTRSH